MRRPCAQAGFRICKDFMATHFQLEGKCLSLVSRSEERPWFQQVYCKRAKKVSGSMLFLPCVLNSKSLSMKRKASCNLQNPKKQKKSTKSHLSQFCKRLEGWKWLPLIYLPKEELRDLCSKNGIPYKENSTKTELQSLLVQYRNWIDVMLTGMREQKYESLIGELMTERKLEEERKNEDRAHENCKKRLFKTMTEMGEITIRGFDRPNPPDSPDGPYTRTEFSVKLSKQDNSEIKPFQRNSRARIRFPCKYKVKLAGMNFRLREVHQRNNMFDETLLPRWELLSCTEGYRFQHHFISDEGLEKACEETIWEAKKDSFQKFLLKYCMELSLIPDLVGIVCMYLWNSCK